MDCMGVAELAAKVPGCSSVWVLVGFAVVALKTGRLVSAVVGAFYRWFVRPAVSPTKFGEWAVVSGASDGIGKEYAIALAKKGMKVVLVARSEDKLKAVADEISAAGSEAKVVAADLTKPEAFADVAAAIEGLEVGVLINNAGLSYSYPDYLVDVGDVKTHIDDWRIDTLVALNVGAVTRMIRLVLPQMAARKKGAIVNLSSGFAIYPTGLMSIYSSTKRYVNHMTLALDQEYRRHGVRFTSLMPNFVSTAMAKQRPSMMVPLPKTFVKSAMGTLGQDLVTSGYMWHELQSYIFSLVPTSVLESQAFKMHLGIRKRAIRKAERLAAEGKRTN
mmetsp:Transcript_36647/g.95979  ORF Transcript_36647/g.95979 Transcript_36647/m.95979 type:complete len:332 (-) Transcript_36647:43-1038(-)|eukprot:CAMPEP_0182925800 /NCGR_PEP_ID=MMETSP0105_2-20130417/10642_1 /TAXON_ID=81532 ORGANISM="Acanthoeca-like sp., Strain 10tr" /NCGR_SAMPLE_ID=MMETSP0105_2 /ASSEMBLY_ACC=CAM_ASM_000205 /LENGTH=331 /DNA_ID=CAMNT_0025063659 /DNA_START=38 /DNA_END=1033 /DNA_ORIENTATION=-